MAVLPGLNSILQIGKLPKIVVSQRSQKDQVAETAQTQDCVTLIIAAFLELSHVPVTH